MVRSRDIPPEILQNMEEPSEKGSIFLGFLGSLLGAAAVMLASIFLWKCDMRFEWGVEEGYLLLPLFFGCVVGWGYRLCHGRRSVLVAFGMVGLVTVLLSLVWLLGLAVFLAYDEMGAGGLSIGDFCYILLRMLSKLWRDTGSINWAPLLPYGALCLVGFLGAYSSLLQYADWKRAPWRMAVATAGGMLYNLLPERLPYGKTPERFCVGKRITVEGEQLYVRSRFKKTRMFTVREIAGVVIGPSGGSNVLFDRTYGMLAKFAGSMEHAELLMKYLLEHHVPMTAGQPDWKPVWTQEPAAGEGVLLPESFTLRMKEKTRKGSLVAGIFFLLLAGSGLAMVAYSWLTERWSGGAAIVVAVLCLFLAGIGWLFIKGIRNHRVEVEDGRLCVVTKWGRRNEFSAGEVQSTSRIAGWLVLYDREWKRLERLDLQMEGIAILERYLRERGA